MQSATARGAGIAGVILAETRSSAMGDREWSRKNDDAALVPAPRRSPSGRVPQWALEETLNEQLRTYAATGRPPTEKPRRMRERRRRPSSTAKLRFRTAGVIALVAALYLTPTVFERYVLPAALPHLPGADVPPRGVDASDKPLGTPPATNGSTQYVLMESPDPSQEFVAYDPCRPVRYVVRPDFAPAGTEGLIEESIAEVSAATGLQFSYDGHTTEAPSEDRQSYQPDLYGKRWAPILITWTSPAEIPGLAGNIAGLGGSEYAHTPGNPFVHVAGQAQLDAPDITQILQYPDGRELVRGIIVHELAHVLGLDHVNDPNQLMFAGNNGRTTLGDDDRAGLAVLGGGPCVPQL